MKVTFLTCCGVDVHKSFLVATIIKTTSGIEPSYQKKRFSTFNNSILEFRQWLLDNDCHDVCMESTGKYWIPVFNLLEDEINVTIANMASLYFLSHYVSLHKTLLIEQFSLHFAYGA